MKRAIVDAKAFAEAMNKVSKVLKKSAIPILEEIAVRIQDDRCTLTATDMETWLVAELPVHGDDMSFVFRRTKDVLKACAHFEGELMLTLVQQTEEDWKLEVLCGQRAAEFPVASRKDYPECGTVEDGKSLQVNAAELFRRVERVRYFSLSNLLVEKEELSALCESMGIAYAGCNRLSVSDAFRSATGDIRERVPVTTDGETNIYLGYCRDNKHTAGILSRELVKETLNRHTNQYEKLANISYDKADGIFRCDNMVYDDAVDVPECCRRAEELFELYQRCANRKQIETICTNYLRALEATKLSITGHMYFVPHTYMDQVDIFEDFILLLSGLNKKATPLVVNSFYIIDDAKQREKMTEEFYLAVKKEIAAYQEKCDYLIKSSSQSPAVMDRWVLKVQALEEKKRHYEGVLQRELSGLDDEFSVLKLLSQELQVRANSIRSQRFQQRAA